MLLPKKATKTTKTTLYQNMQFSGFGIYQHILLQVNDNPGRTGPIFFGKADELQKLVPGDIWPILDPQNILPALKWPKTIIQNLKNCIFWNFIKIDLNALKYQIGVQNDSKTPQGPISGHISSFRPISATLSKFEFLAKIDFLANFGIFDFSKFDLLFGRKWPEI